MTDFSVFRDKLEPDLWRVEDNDYNDDGGCTFTLWAGRPSLCKSEGGLL
jgi:hypothetical protein